LRPSKGTHDEEKETTDVTVESPQYVDADDFRRWWEQGLAPTATRGRWKLTPKGRALFGVVSVIGSVLALKACAPGSDLFTHNNPAHMQSSVDKTVAESSDMGAQSGNDSAQSAQGKIAKEQLDDLSTRASLSPLPPGGSKDAQRIQPAAGVSSATPVDAQALASLASQSSSGQSSDLEPARTIPSALGSDDRRAPPSSSKLDLPTKRPGKITNRVVVATTETTVHSAAPDIPSEPLAAAKPAKVEEASPPRAAQATAQQAAVPPASPETTPLDPLLRAIRDLFGAWGSPAQPSIDPTPTASTGWAVQLAASRSENEAKNHLKQLNARYASALNGSTIRMQKTGADGATVYRLRVVGLSKADAGALCSRLKGDGGSCFVVR
jgi:hypothetical protein